MVRIKEKMMSEVVRVGYGKLLKWSERSLMVCLVREN